MNDGETNRRTDAQLIIVLDETAAWAVRGENGAPMGPTASLRDALTVSAALGRARRTIVALVQAPDDRVIASPPQIERLIEARN